VLHVAEQVLVTPRVVETDDGRTRQRGATEGEQVVGGVVEEDTDVDASVDARWTAREEEVREAAALGDVLRMGPDVVAEPHGGPVAPLRVVRVRPQERGRVRGGHGRLTRGGHAPAT
jgi:hypothetical protein